MEQGDRAPGASLAHQRVADAPGSQLLACDGLRLLQGVYYLVSQHLGNIPINIELLLSSD